MQIVTQYDLTVGDKSKLGITCSMMIEVSHASCLLHVPFMFDPMILSLCSRTFGMDLNNFSPNLITTCWSDGCLARATLNYLPSFQVDLRLKEVERVWGKSIASRTCTLNFHLVIATFRGTNLTCDFGWDSDDDSLFRVLECLNSSMRDHVRWWHGCTFRCYLTLIVW